MIYNSDVKVICTQNSTIRGTVQRLNLRTSMIDDRKTTIVFCSFYDKSPECMLCVNKLMNYLDRLEIRDSNEVINTEAIELDSKASPI